MRFARCSIAKLMVLASGCAFQADAPRQITLATTTSTRDSGLLDVLLPMFHRQTGIEVKVIAVGTGQALELGRRGDADVLLTHAPDAEKALVAGGHAPQRRSVMYNDFVLVGPSTDPAGVRDLVSAPDALAAIASAQARFVSRGDNSGTHMKEAALWKACRTDPQGNWYVQAGGGMAHALRMASEMQAYTLADRGTYLAQRESLDLDNLNLCDPRLRNPYAVMTVNPQRHPDVRGDLAAQFADFLTSPSTQQVIAEYGIKQFGQTLFFPDAKGNSAGGAPDH